MICNVTKLVRHFRGVSTVHVLHVTVHFAIVANGGQCPAPNSPGMNSRYATSLNHKVLAPSTPKSLLTRMQKEK